MRRALTLLLAVAVCVVFSGCSSGEKNNTDKPDGKEQAEHKDDHGDHEGHGEEGHGDHDDKDDAHDPHAPAEKPLVIVPDLVAASDHVTEIFANDHARVFEIELHKGEKLPLHECGAHAVYAVTDLDLSFVEVHGHHTHSHKDKHSSGSVHAHGAGAHGIDNLADGDAKLIVFERKTGDAFTDAAPADAEAINKVSKFATSLLSGSDDFRVYKVALPTGEKIENHFLLNRIVYALEDGKVTLTDSDGNADPHELKAGQAHYHSAGSGTLENSGDSIVTLLIVEMKR